METINRSKFALLTLAAVAAGCGGGAASSPGTAVLPPAGPQQPVPSVVKGPSGPILVANGPGLAKDTPIVTTDLAAGTALVAGVSGPVDLANPVIPGYHFAANGQVWSDDGKVDMWAQMSEDKQFITVSFDGNKTSMTYDRSMNQVASRPFVGTFLKAGSRSAQQIAACGQSCNDVTSVALALIGWAGAVVFFTATPAGWAAASVAGITLAWETYAALSHR